MMRSSTLLLVLAVSLSMAGGAFAQEACAPTQERHAAHVHGETSGTHAFAQPVGPSWTFMLKPAPHGWDVRLLDQSGLDLSQVTPPYRLAPNSRELYGWHFRNAANTGANTGNVNAPQHNRPFQFSPSLSGTGGFKPSAPFAAPDETQGRGVLTIVDMGLSDLEPGTKARMSYIKFSACITWPKAAEDNHANANTAGMNSASTVETNQDMLLFPTDGIFNPQEQTWIVPIHGWVFTHKQAPHLQNKIVSELEGIFGSTENVRSNQYFQRRLRMFVIENIFNKKIRINIGQQTLALPATTEEGYFEAEVAVPAAELYRKKCSDWVMYDVVQEQPDSQQFLGQSQCVETEGVSVISSIDDTIKVTNVSDKKSALANTFLKKYVAIPKMAIAYRAWREKGWRFHYVSSLPWQLYPPLVDFMEIKGFPLGGFYFRQFYTKKESIAELFTNFSENNFQTIQSILMRYPKRQFILVGGADGRDPEVYGRVARLFPNQIKHIFILSINKQEPNNKELQNAFEDLPDSLWSIVTEGRELYN